MLGNVYELAMPIVGIEVSIIISSWTDSTMNEIGFREFECRGGGGGGNQRRRD